MFKIIPDIHDYRYIMLCFFGRCLDIFYPFSKVKTVPEIIIQRDSLNNEVLVALLALVGTLSGTFGGILTSSKLTAYRIEQLERKVDIHNSFAERIPIIEEKLKEFNKRLDNIEIGK